MSVQPPGKGWNILGGIFLGCGGLLLILLGGVCSVALGSSASLSNGSGSLLLLCLILVAGGVAFIYQAVKLFRR